MVSMPMRAEGKIIGVLNVASRVTGRPFSPLDLEYLNLVCNNAAAAIENVLTRRSRDETYSLVVIALARLAESRDNDTGQHLDRVTRFCLTLARELRLYPEYVATIDAQFLRDVQLAAPLHDIGKVAIPDSILLKPGKLTEGEMAVMRTHVIVGVEAIESILAQAPGTKFLHMTREMIGFHHERFDGSGYPDCLQGSEIPFSARLLAVADVYDALTTKRVYKKAIPHAKAVEIIAQQSGTHFDPVIVRAFLQCANEFEHLARELSDAASSAAAEGAPELQEAALKG
jgi:putative two-component system response regulator